MAKAALKTDVTCAADVIRVRMAYSKFGAMAQLFIIDSMQKAIKPTPTHQGRETNDKLVARFLRADKLAGRSEVVDAVRAQAEAVEAAGLEGVRESFKKSGAAMMIHPDSWHGVALEILRDLRAVG